MRTTMRAALTCGLGTAMLLTVWTRPAEATPRLFSQMRSVVTNRFAAQNRSNRDQNTQASHASEQAGARSASTKGKPLLRSAMASFKQGLQQRTAAGRAAVKKGIGSLKSKLLSGNKLGAKGLGSAKSDEGLALLAAGLGFGGIGLALFGQEMTLRLIGTGMTAAAWAMITVAEP